jgi:DNA-binding response OmpR family regulator
MSGMEHPYYPSAIVPRDSLHILAVDNDLADIFSNVLRAEGFGHVDTATDGLAALGRIATRSYDLILLNYYMPRMNGAVMLRHLRNRGCKTPVIMITAWSYDDIPEPLGDLDLADFIEKPFSNRSLAQKIDGAITTHWKNGQLATRKSISSFHPAPLTPEE